VGCRSAVLLVAGMALVGACSSSDPDPVTASPTSPTSSVASSGVAQPTTSPAAPSGPPKVVFTEVASVSQPVDLRIRSGDPTTLFVAERAGRITAFRNDQTTQVVLDITERTTPEGERGLLGFTFSPDGGSLYVDYTDRNGDSHVDVYPITSDGTADKEARKELLFQKQPYPNHNGGNLVFGPDGMLYIGFGDGGSEGDPQNRAPNLNTWLGKILRVDPSRTNDLAPGDNPFVGKPGAKP
jgi:glucose/arabinose dehydrogenase